MLLTLLAGMALIRPSVGSQIYFRAETDAYQSSPEVLPSREYHCFAMFVARR